jgi:SlyX protein
LPDTQDTPQRLTELEIKASFTEETLEQLNQVIIRQQQQIDQLLRELVLLREQSQPGQTGVPLNLRDDLPPHF